MPIALILPLIVKYGPTAAQAIYNVVKLWHNKAEITDADWQQLHDINARPLEFYEGKPAAPAPTPTNSTVL